MEQEFKITLRGFGITKLWICKDVEELDNFQLEFKSMIPELMKIMRLYKDRIDLVDKLNGYDDDKEDNKLKNK